MSSFGVELDAHDHEMNNTEPKEDSLLALLTELNYSVHNDLKPDGGMMYGVKPATKRTQTLISKARACMITNVTAKLDMFISPDANPGNLERFILGDDLVSLFFKMLPAEALLPDALPTTIALVIDQALLFILKGLEATSAAIAWAVYLLSQHDAIRKELQVEADRVLPKDNSKITPDIVNGLVFTEQCLLEAMRLYPSIPFIMRECTQEHELGGYTIPEGSNIILALYALHRDPNTFPDPNHFRPERFAPLRRVSIGPFAYLPFGGGARACMGKDFTMSQAKIILAKLSKNFEFSYKTCAGKEFPADGPPLHRLFVPRADDLTCGVRKRVTESQPEPVWKSEMPGFDGPKGRGPDRPNDYTYQDPFS